MDDPKPRGNKGLQFSQFQIEYYAVKWHVDLCVCLCMTERETERRERVGERAWP